MLSTEHRFLFLHIPKTGGNSIQDLLRPFSDDRIVCLAPHQDGVERFELRSDRYRTQKHSTLQEYRREYGDALFDSLFRFTCARNPWDRVVSHYFSPHRGRVEWDRESFAAFIPRVRPMLHYLRLEPETGLVQALRHVHRVLRFETLQADFDELCRTLELPRLALPQRNRSQHDDYRRYYDDETRELVARRFAGEVRCLGYAF